MAELNLAQQNSKHEALVKEKEEIRKEREGLNAKVEELQCNNEAL